MGVACITLPLWTESMALPLEVGALVLHATHCLYMSNTCERLFNKLVHTKESYKPDMFNYTLYRYMQHFIVNKDLL